MFQAMIPCDQTETFPNDALKFLCPVIIFFMAFVETYSRDEPAREFVDSLTEPLVVEFGANWCGYCQMLQPELAALFKNYPQVRHIKVEDGKGKPLGRGFRVKLWPSLVFMHHGKVLLQLARPTIEEVAKGMEELSNLALRR